MSIILKLYRCSGTGQVLCIRLLFASFRLFERIYLNLIVLEKKYCVCSENATIGRATEDLLHDNPYIYIRQTLSGH